MLRMVPFPTDCLTSFDHIITNELLPTLTGRKTFTDEELTVLRLPTRLGGLAIPHFQRMADCELTSSRSVTDFQVAEIVNQHYASWLPVDLHVL